MVTPKAMKPTKTAGWGQDKAHPLDHERLAPLPLREQRRTEEAVKFTHQSACAEQSAYMRWLTRLAIGPDLFALAVLALSGFVRIATNPRIFDPPSTLESAFAAISSRGDRPTARIVGPGPEHLAILERRCRVGQLECLRSSDAGPDIRR